MWGVFVFRKQIGLAAHENFIEFELKILVKLQLAVVELLAGSLKSSFFYFLVLEARVVTLQFLLGWN